MAHEFTLFHILQTLVYLFDDDKPLKKIFQINFLWKFMKR